MLKKIICITLALVLCSCSAFAQVQTEATDVENDIISISAASFPGESVTIMITNPGYSKEDAISGSDGAIQYFNSYLSSDSEFTHPVKIMGNVGGEFNVYIMSRDGEQSASFTFYNSVFKKKCIEDINDAPAGSDITLYFENLINSYGLTDNPMYTTLGSQAVSGAFLLLRDTRADKKIPNDISEVMDMINESFVLAAFNTGNSELAFDGKNLLHEDILSLDNTDEMNDYKNSVSPEGAEYIKQKLLEGGYKDISSIADKFKELVYRGVLLNFKERGYGHIHSFFKKYEPAYEKAGFNIPAKENQTKYLKLLEFTDESLEELAERFNSIKDTSASNKPSSGGSSSGGSFSTGGGTSYVNPDPQPVPSEKKNFSDVSDNHWASEAIQFLSNKKWISGYEDGTFRPDAKITRAEYTKLILTVFGIEAVGSESFDDVDSAAWYATFVASAQKHGIIMGNGNYFYPENNLSRQDAAVIICRIIKKSSEDSLVFTDREAVADYAKASVSYLSSKQIINGYEDGTFRPEGSISRAEIAKILYTLCRKGEIIE